MIRKSQSEDMASIILALWMKSTIYAHPFIEERYWHESEVLYATSFTRRANLGMGGNDN